MDIPAISFAVVMAIAFGAIGALLRYLTSDPEKGGPRWDIVGAHLVFAAIGFVVTLMFIAPAVLPDGH